MTNVLENKLFFQAILSANSFVLQQLPGMLLTVLGDPQLTAQAVALLMIFAQQS